MKRSARTRGRRLVASAFRHRGVNGGLIALVAGFVGWLAPREERQPEGPDHPQPDLLLAVSSAAPVALPDTPEEMLERKTRFTIVLEQNNLESTTNTDTREVAPSRVDPPFVTRRLEEDDDDDDGGIIWFGADGGAHGPAQSRPAGPDGREDSGLTVSRTDVTDQRASAPESGSGAAATEATDRAPAEEGAPQFVSITRLNEQMGPPAPEEDDDDEAGWLWFGDGPGGWFASLAAGLLGGGLGGGGAAGAAVAETATTSGLNIAFAAGPFLDGELAIRAVDSAGNLLFIYEGDAVGDSLDEGVTLTGIATDRVGDQRVITGLEVEFEDFSGPVFLQVEAGSSYIDEALEDRVELDTPLRGTGEVPEAGVGEVSLTPFTELAIQLIETDGDGDGAPDISVSLEAPDTDGLTAAQRLFDSAADRVRDLTGVDIRDARPVVVNQGAFDASADLDANQYGLKLAGLSELSGETVVEDRVQTAIDKLTADIKPVVDTAAGSITFDNPGRALANQVELTDSLEAFVSGDVTIRDRVIDADRPVTPPTIDEFVVVSGDPVITGTAQLQDVANTAGEATDLDLRVALNDQVVFSVGEVEGPGSGDLSITDPGDTDTAGSWSLTLVDLDPGVYGLDVFVVDPAANATEADGIDNGRGPQLQFVSQALPDPEARTTETITLDEGESVSTELAVSDLDAGDVVTTRSLEVSADPANTLVLSDAEIAALIDFPGSGDEVLGTDARFSIRDLSFSGDASILDALAAGETADLTYTIVVEDSTGNISNEGVLDVVVEGTNDAPTLTIAGSVTNSEDELESGITVDAQSSDLLANATDVDDADGSLTIAEVEGASSSVGSAVTVTLTYPDADGVNQTQDVALTVSSDGSYSIASLDLDALPAGENATGTFTYKVADDGGALSSAQIANVSISGTNDAPALTAGSVTNTEDQLESGISVDAQSSNLLANATDVDDADGSLTIAEVEGTSSHVGSAVTVTLSYTDADGNSLQQDIDLTVNGDGSYSTAGVDLDELSVGQSATGTFTYRVADDSGALSPQVSAQVTINGSDDPPVITTGPASAILVEAGGVANANVGTPLSEISLSIDDVDALDTAVYDQAYLTDNGWTKTFNGLYTKTGNFGEAEFSVATGVVVYTLDNDLAATEALEDGESVNESFTIQVRSNGETATADAVFSITGANDAPTLATAGSVTNSEDELESGILVDAASSNLLTSATDVDDDDETLVIAEVDGDPANVGSAVAMTLTYPDADGVNQTQDVDLTVSGDGSYSIASHDLDALPAGENATGAFTYKVADDEGALSSQQTANVTITGTNDAPTLSPNDITATEVEVSGGYDVSSGESSLLDGAADVDDSSGDLAIDGFGDANQVEASAGGTIEVDLTYTNDAGSGDSGHVELTLNADGSYALGNLSFDDMAPGTTATGDFFYQVADPDGATSPLEAASITIKQGNGGGVLEVDLSAGPFVTGTFAVTGYAEDGSELFIYENAALTQSASGVSLLDQATRFAELRPGLAGQLPEQAQNAINNTPGGLPPGLQPQTALTEGFEISLDGYEGDVLLRVTDASGETAAYVDEASTDVVELTGDIRALASVSAGASTGVSVTPFSEAAVALAERGSSELNFSNLSSGDLSTIRDLYPSAANIVTELVGVDPLQDRARPINVAEDPSKQTASDNQYGLKLAALSQTNESVKAGIDTLLQGIAVSASNNQLELTDRVAFIEAKLALTDALESYLGRNDLPAQAKPTDPGGGAPGSGDFLVEDRQAPLASTVTVNGLLTGDTTPELTGTVTLTDSRNENGEPDDLDFEVIVNGEVFEYAGGSGDIAVDAGAGTWSLDLDAAGISALSDGTYSVTAVLTDPAENATADGSSDELVIDSIRPDVTLDAAKSVFRPGDSLTQISATFTKTVTGLEAGDFQVVDNSPGVDVFQIGVFTNTGTDQVLAIRPLSASPGLAESTFVSFTLPDGSVEDAAGNGNTTSNTERVIVLGDDAVDSSGDTDDILDESTALKGGTNRSKDTGEFVHGDAGDDILFGYGGDDVLLGGADDDVLLGEAGADTLIAGAGDDFMAGGSGNDVYLLDEFGRDLGSENIFIGNSGDDRVELTGATDDYLINTVDATEVAQLNELLSDNTANDNGVNEFRGFEMPDLQFDTTIPVLRIDYRTDSGRQTDFVQADSYVFADTTLEFTSNVANSNEAFLTPANPDDAFVHNGGGRPIQETGANNLLGGNAGDRLIGGDGDDEIRGGAGDDVLVSLGGADYLDAGSGDDTLVGMGIGAESADLNGGEGEDTFVAAPQLMTSAGLTVKDFDLVDDLINLDGVYTDDAGTVFNAGDLAKAFDDAAADARQIEIDLSSFFVEDPDNTGSYESGDGIVKIELADNKTASDLSPGSEVPYTADNPVGQTTWWNDLLDDGGLI